MEEKNTNVTQAGLLALILADVETHLIIKTGKETFTAEEVKAGLEFTAKHVYQKLSEIGFDWTEELKFSSLMKKTFQN